MALLKKKWDYLNEGNLHIIIRVRNTDHVIRLTKESENSHINLEQMSLNIDFVNMVTNPLILNATEEKQQLLTLTPEETEKLPELLLEYRPKHRLHKQRISCFAIAAPNLTYLNAAADMNFCIEIKPKEGFLPDTLKQVGKCFYCLKQFSKIKDNLISKISNYCPLDLFSGDKERMLISLQNLVENPQNNFRVFYNSLLIYDENSMCKHQEMLSKMGVFEDTTQLLSFIVEILISSHNENSSIAVETSKQKNTCDFEEQSNKTVKICQEGAGPAPHSILHTLLGLQKLQTSSAVQSEEHSLDYAQSMLSLIKTKDLNLRNDTDKALFLQCLKPYHLAMISAIFRDCSLMISFSTSYIEGYPYISFNNIKLPYKVSVTDLEPKHPSTLGRRIKTEGQLIDYYKRFLSSSHIMKPEQNS